MIKTKVRLKEYLKYEKPLYPNTISDRLTMDQRVYNWRYIKYLRRCEFYYNNREKSFKYKLFYLYLRLRKNLLGAKIGVEIWENSFGKGLIIHHNGSIVVNRQTVVGTDCKLHGDNCIGNSGTGTECPVIGNNVDIGVGAKIIGNIYIADNIKIGAGAIVNKSFYEEGIIVAGVPARKVIKDKVEV